MSYPSPRPVRYTDRAFTPYVTYSVAALSVALSVAFWIGGEKTGTFGQVSVERIWSGDWGGLITPTLLHASLVQNPFHLLFNLLWLLRLGPMVERTLGRLEYAVFLAIAALVGSGVQIAFTSQESIGLSGVVYAVWGLCWAARRSVPDFQLVSTRQTTQYMIGWLLLCIVLTKIGAMSIANGAHVGGLIFGVAIGWLFVDRSSPARYRIAGGAMLAGLAVITVLSVSYMPWSIRWQEWRAASSSMGDQANIQFRGVEAPR